MGGISENHQVEQQVEQQVHQYQDGDEYSDDDDVDGHYQQQQQQVIQEVAPDQKHDLALEPQVEAQDWKFMTFNESWSHEVRGSGKPAGFFGTYPHFSKLTIHTQAESSCRGMTEFLQQMDQYITVDQFKALWAKHQKTLEQEGKRLMKIYDGGLHGFTPFHVAVVYGNVPLVKYLLELAGTERNRLLMVNMLVNNMDVMDFIFKQGFDVDDAGNYSVHKSVADCKDLFNLVYLYYVNHAPIMQDLVMV
jgi:hypothetical protein